MNAPRVELTYVGGPTFLLQFGRLRLLTILHLGAARAPAVGPFHLTMTAKEGVEGARSFANAVVVPSHFEDWAHFSEGRSDIAAAFADARFEQRLRWPERGRTLTINFPSPIAKAG